MAVEQSVELSPIDRAIEEIQAFDPGERTVWPGNLNLGEIGEGRQVVYETVTYKARSIGDKGREIPTDRIERQPAVAVREGDLTRPLVYHSDFDGQGELALQVLDRIQAFRGRVT